MRTKAREHIKNIEKIIDDKIMDFAKPKIREFNELMAYYQCAIMEIETKFNVLNREFSLRYDRNPINGIKSRLKSTMSIKEKLKRKNLDFTIENIENYINDIAGIRIICSFSDDVYMLADAFLRQDDITLIEIKDYIKNPKSNGYRSLHLIVSVPIFLSNEKKSMRAEIQIRTIAMDSWASLEHQLRYKKDFKISEEMAEELLYCANLSAELDRRMDALKIDLRDENDNFDS